MINASAVVVTVRADDVGVAHNDPFQAEEIAAEALPRCTSSASLLIASRKVGTVNGSITRGPNPPRVSFSWRDQTPLKHPDDRPTTASGLSCSAPRRHRRVSQSIALCANAGTRP